MCVCSVCTCVRGCVCICMCGLSICECFLPKCMFGIQYACEIVYLLVVITMCMNYQHVFFSCVLHKTYVIM